MFSRFDPRPRRPHFSNLKYDPHAERRPFCKKVFGHGTKKAWFSRFGRPRGAVGHFIRFGAHLRKAHFLTLKYLTLVQKP